MTRCKVCQRETNSLYFYEDNRNGFYALSKSGTPMGVYICPPCYCGHIKARYSHNTRLIEYEEQRCKIDFQLTEVRAQALPELNPPILQEVLLCP